MSSSRPRGNVARASEIKAKTSNKSILYYRLLMPELVQVKRIILVGSLNGPYFVIRTAKMDRSRSDFTDLCS